MDGREVLLNILHEMKDNLRVLFNWGAVKSGDQLIRTRFDKWSRTCHPMLVPEEATPTTQGADSAESGANVMFRFAEITAEHLNAGQKVNDSRTELTRIQKELVEAEARLFHLRMSHKQLEDQRQQETRGRMDVIGDLKNRLQMTAKRTTCSIRLAKACSDLAKKEWQNEIQKPIEERNFHFNTLGSRLQTLIKENATIEAQLTKCREERETEVVQVSTQMDDEIKKRQELLEQLKKEVAEECVHLQKLEESLAIVTVDYNVIMDRRRKEAEEELRKRLEERARERAAIKIQQWFRFYLFRTMKARKRRKKAKRKISREVKKEMSTSSAATGITESSSGNPKDVASEPVHEEADETRIPVAVLVSRKSDNANKTVSTDGLTSDTEQPTDESPGKSKKKTSKKGAVRSVTVKKNGQPKAPKADAEVKSGSPPVANIVNRASQTDNRVPKTKQTYK